MTTPTPDPLDLRRQRDRLVQRVETGELDPAAFTRLYSDAADGFLVRLFEQATPGGAKGLALLAVGGFGRRELAPGSDLDVALVHARRRDVSAIADPIWYALWDSGIPLDHSVRTPREAIEVATGDLRVLLGLLDGRLVAGDEAMVGVMLEQVRGLWRAHAGRYLPELSRGTRERHGRFGEVPFLLEPDLKESAGGLRDLENLALAALARPEIAHTLPETDLAAARRLLTRARVGLQVRTGNSSDRLVLEEQDGLAKLLGYEDADDLMASLGEAGRQVMWATDDAWRRIASVLAGPGRRSGRPVPVAEGVVWRDGEVALTAETDLRADPAAVVRLAVAAAAREAPIASSSLHRLAAEWQPLQTERWPDELREGFVSLLEYGASAVPVLEAFDQRHLLERLLPEWAHVRHLPQRNAYHRYTVDRHLLETVAQAARLIRSVRRPDLLLLGALLHDIGKGREGDHSVVGSRLARQIGTRIGLGGGDVDILERLVAHHLLLADTATRRDIEDPATIGLVAGHLRDRATLELLTALTEADSIATGPAAWSDWKATLIRDLARRVDAAMRGEQPRSYDPPVLTEEHRLLMASGRLAVRLDGHRLTVVAPDRPGLFSLVAGTLALHRLDIRRAYAAGDSLGMAVEVFDIGADPATPVDVDDLRRDIAEAMAGRLLLDARLASLERAYGRPSRRAPGPGGPGGPSGPRRPSGPGGPGEPGGPGGPVAPQEPAVLVVIDEEASSYATVVEVRAPDSRGLLHRLTRALAARGLDVVSAQIQTLGHEVVDSFYVQGFDRTKPSAQELSGLERELEDAARRGAL
jgi:[protein-PII] uridylyltransferase